MANTPFYLPNCGLTHIKGTIRQQGSNTPIRGITVRVWFDGAAVDEIYSNPSDTNGEWDVVLADYAWVSQILIKILESNLDQASHWKKQRRCIPNKPFVCRVL